MSSLDRQPPCRRDRPEGQEGRQEEGCCQAQDRKAQDHKAQEEEGHGRDQAEGQGSQEEGCCQAQGLHRGDRVGERGRHQAGPLSVDLALLHAASVAASEGQEGQKGQGYHRQGQEHQVQIGQVGLDYIIFIIISNIFILLDFPRLSRL